MRASLIRENCWAYPLTTERTAACGLAPSWISSRIAPVKLSSLSMSRCAEKIRDSTSDRGDSVRRSSSTWRRVSSRASLETLHRLRRLERFLRTLRRRLEPGLIRQGPAQRHSAGGALAADHLRVPLAAGLPGFQERRGAMQHRRQLGGHGPQGGLFLDVDGAATFVMQLQHASARGTQGDGQGQAQSPGSSARAPDGTLPESLHRQCVGGAARVRRMSLPAVSDRPQGRPRGAVLRQVNHAVPGAAVGAYQLRGALQETAYIRLVLE